MTGAGGLRSNFFRSSWVFRTNRLVRFFSIFPINVVSLCRVIRRRTPPTCEHSSGQSLKILFCDSILFKTKLLGSPSSLIASNKRKKTQTKILIPGNGANHETKVRFGPRPEFSRRPWLPIFRRIVAGSEPVTSR